MSIERPILFNTAMVQAILAGTKTQTRRQIKGSHDHIRFNGIAVNGKTGYENEHGHSVTSPPANVGDVFWVREAFLPDPNADSDVWSQEGSLHTYYSWDGCGAKVSELPEPFHSPDNCLYRASWNGPDLAWRPSIHMPRWAARIFLKVTGVRCERLQDITEANAQAEGFAKVTKDGQLYKYGLPDSDGLPGNDDFGWPWPEWETEAKQAFSKLWQSTYQNWDENPWVWVVDFEVIKTPK